MRRVRILKNCKQGKTGEIVSLDNNEAWGLVENGYAEVTKDMTPDDYKQAGDKNGRITQLRSNKS